MEIIKIKRWNIYINEFFIGYGVIMKFYSIIYINFNFIVHINLTNCTVGTLINLHCKLLFNVFT